MDPDTIPLDALNRAQIDQAYAHCLALARSHYENFPVASLLVPKALRGPVAAIYAFARSADGRHTLDIYNSTLT